MTKQWQFPDDDWRRHHSPLPQDIIRNEADVVRAAYKPRRPLTTVQRIGAVLLGIMLAFPFAVIVASFENPRSLVGSGIHGLAYLVIVIALAGCALVGVRMVWNGLSGGPKAGRYQR